MLLMQITRTQTVLRECHDFCVQSHKLLLAGVFENFAFVFELLTYGGQKGLPLPKISRTYPTMMKLSTVIPNLKKIQKIYESYDTPPDFC